MAGQIPADVPQPTSRKRKAPPNGEPPELEPWTYTPQRILGKGSFGTVYQALVQETGEIVAIKSTRMATNGDGCWKQLTGEKEREVQVLKELEGHPNIVSLRGAFLTETKGSPEAKLNLVLEFLSDTLHRVLKHHNAIQKTIDIYYVKLYFYQLMRGIAFIHGRGIVHCDIKPQNLLLDGKSHTLKLCDFGTAKRLVMGKALVAYACSRYYRAPELILGATQYSTSVDLWSAGCVLGEMLLGQPLFTGTDGINQLVEIIKVLGTPTPSQLRAMNPNYPEYEFQPKVTPHPWDKVFRGWTSREANDLIDVLLRYDPSARLPPLYVLMHRFFDSLRADEKPSHRVLFTFRPDELWWCAQTHQERLIPRWIGAKQAKVETV